MRRTWIVVGLLVGMASAFAYQKTANWKEFHFTGSRLKVDLAQPDALIRTESLTKLPRDLLKVPLARDVLTEDLVFYYEQHEDRLGFNGAVKRIAYEHKLGWNDRIVASIFNEPAEIAFWRDGKGALRHYALVLKRGFLTKVLQEAATVALKDSQLKRAGEIDLGDGKAAVLLALQVNPRRTLLLASHGERVAVLSDPGLLFNSSGGVVPEAAAALADWLKNDGVLARRFALDAGVAVTQPKPAHTLAIGAPTLALGYAAFVPGFKGVRFDFGESWATSLQLPPNGQPAEAALWQAIPANPAACVALPVNWPAVQALLKEEKSLPPLPDLSAVFGGGAACWYGESSLYSPVFLVRMNGKPAQHGPLLQALANWAINAGVQPAKAKGKDDTQLWRAVDRKAAVAARGQYVAFSPDGALVDRVLDTIARTQPSIADQQPASAATLALLTPRVLATMAEKEITAALAGSGDTNLQGAVQTHLPARMKALAAYPPYRLEMAVPAAPPRPWQAVEWRAAAKK